MIVAPRGFLFDFVLARVALSGPWGFSISKFSGGSSSITY